MFHPQLHHFTQLPAVANNHWQSAIHTSATGQTGTRLSMLRFALSRKSRELLYWAFVCKMWRLIPFGAEIMLKAGSSFVSHVMLNAGVDTSCKTAFVMSLLAELVAKGHRTLIFSQSRVMLDILQAAILEQSYAFRRIDGSISSAAERQVSVFCMHASCA